MSKTLPKILFFYSAIASFFIAVSTILTSQSGAPVIFATLFLPVVAYFTTEVFINLRSMFGKKTATTQPTFSEMRTSEAIILSLLFIMLLGVGIKNVITGSQKQTEVVPPKQNTQLIIPKNKTQNEPLEKKTLTVEISDGSESVNIRSKASLYSDKVGTAKNGQQFEYTEKKGEWYEIKLEDGTNGYISFKYVQGENKQ